MQKYIGLKNNSSTNKVSKYKKDVIFGIKIYHMTIDNLRSDRGKELKALRKAKGITQQQMAQISGISLPTVIRMEGGKVSWSIDCELRFRNALVDLPDKEKANKKITA